MHSIIPTRTILVRNNWNYSKHGNIFSLFLVSVFPAGILQPLFYSQNFPKSLNYGGIGVVIGHGNVFSFLLRLWSLNLTFVCALTEITHGFDDKGRQFDKEGNMMQWWNNATIRNFRERAQCIIDQYSRYRIDEVGLYMNGRMTQGNLSKDLNPFRSHGLIVCFCSPIQERTSPIMEAWSRASGLTKNGLPHTVKSRIFLALIYPMTSSFSSTMRKSGVARCDPRMHSQKFAAQFIRLE